jgi:hypothetical protein
MPSKKASDDDDDAAPDVAAVMKLPRNLTQRIQFIEASLEKLRVELEDAEGDHKDAIEKLMKQAQHVLMRLRVLH